MNLSLPAFARILWVNQNASETYAPRLARLRELWWQVEYRSVCEGIRDVALLQASGEEFPALHDGARSHGLRVEMLRVEELNGVGSLQRRTTIHAAVGRKRQTKTLREAWIARDSDAIGTLLGFPPCCRRFFHIVNVKGGFSDTAWLMARHSNPAIDAENSIAMSGFAENNILLRSLGVRAVPHLPCRGDCKPSRDFGRKFIALLRQLKYGDEADWILEMLNWKMTWSGLHGIAEIRTPMMKFATDTDATAEKYTVTWQSLASLPVLNSDAV